MKIYIFNKLKFEVFDFSKRIIFKLGILKLCPNTFLFLKVEET